MALLGSFPVHVATGVHITLNLSRNIVPVSVRGVPQLPQAA